jgi:hypothetical protein
MLELVMKCDVCLELLEEYLDGELASVEQEQVAEHLIGCASCSEEFAMLTLEAEQRNRRAAVEREAEQANSPDAIAATNPAEVVTFVLSPYSTRERAPRVMLKPGINMLDLWLLRSADEGLRKYEAQVVLVGGEDPFTIRNLHVEPRPEGNAIRVRIPTRLLKRGTYQIELKAGSQNEEPKTISEFTLHVGG